MTVEDAECDGREQQVSMSEILCQCKLSVYHRQFAQSMKAEHAAVERLWEQDLKDDANAVLSDAVTFSRRMRREHENVQKRWRGAREHAAAVQLQSVVRGKRGRTAPQQAKTDQLFWHKSTLWWLYQCF